MTVRELIDLLSVYALDRDVIFLDPDTGWWMQPHVSESIPGMDKADKRNPVFVTSTYWEEYTK